MKKVKIISISLVSIFVLLYAAFLLVIPNVINLNNYKDEIKKIALESAKINVDIDDIRIVTTPMLSAGVKVKGLTVAYPGGNVIAQANSAVLRLKLLPLLFKTIQLDIISAENPSITLNLLKNGQLELVKYFENPAAEESTETAPLPFNISDKMPKISLKDYSLAVVDKSTNDSIKVSGQNLVIDKTVLNKHFRVQTDGKVLFNDKENVLYNLKIDSFLPEIKDSQETAAPSEMPEINFISELIKYDLKANLNADLKIRETKDKSLKINGFFNVDDFSAKIGSEVLPQSFAHIEFMGDRFVADSDLNISKDEKIDIKADVKHSKNLSADLNVKTEKLTFSGILRFAAAIADSLNIKNDFSKLSVNGYITSDFSLKTDLKKFESRGFFKILNGALSYSPASITQIGADIDFSDNNVNIKNASALVNGAKIEAKGTVNSKSVADIKINSQVIPLQSIYTVFAPVSIKKAYDLQSGNLSINALIQGKLDEIQPELSLNIDNLKIKDTVNGIILSNQKALTEIKASLNSFSGNVNITGLRATMLNPQLRLNIPSIKVKIDPKNINIIPFEAYADSSAVKIAGSVKNYVEKPDINITADGTISSSDLKTMLPKESREFVSAKGKMPVIAVISGDGVNINISAQLKADSNNYFTPVNIKRLINKPSLLSAALTYANDTVNIDDIGLYELSTASFTTDTKKNLYGSTRIAGVTGAVSNVSKVPVMKKVSINIQDPLLMTLASMPTASLKARGHINVNGKLDSPLMGGYINLSAIGLPDFLTKIQAVDINFNKNTITADVQELSLNGSLFNITADAPASFGNIFVINKLTVTSPNTDAEKLFEIAEKFPQSSNTTSLGSTSKGPVYPVKILSGTGNIEKFSMGTIAASSISSDFTMSNDVLYLKNLKASAYDGTITGNVSYNLVSLLANAKVSGKNIDANPAVTAFMNIKDQLTGRLDFNADVSLKGADYNEQMKTLKGKADFKVSDGQMGSLGRFETFLRADNLLSQSFVSTQIGSLISAVSPYNTGKFSYLNGDMTFNNGIATFSYIKSSGPHMSLNISGTMGLINNNANLQILGKLSPEVVNGLGPIANLSVENLASLIPKLGAKISSAIGAYNLQSNTALLGKIPDLTPVKENTKSFKVVINGSMLNPASAVKSFQWLNSASDMQTGKKSILELLKAPSAATETPVINKETIKEDLKHQIQNSETVQKIQQNEKVQQLNSIFQMYKDAKAKDEAAKQAAPENPVE